MCLSVKNTLVCVNEVFALVRCSGLGVPLISCMIGTQLTGPDLPFEEVLTVRFAYHERIGNYAPFERLTQKRTDENGYEQSTV